MSAWRTVITDFGFTNVDAERQILAEAGSELTTAQCKTPAEVIAAAAEADALIVQWAPITAEVIAALKRCKVIVRYGIGVDNVDLLAAKVKGISVCNVPDYCIDEVADHTAALAMTLARQVGVIDRRLREGTWKITPDRAIPAFSEMVFATAGLGRIARAVLERMKPFRFQLAAYDPFLKDELFQERSVKRLSVDELFSRADILSLHLPLTAETAHFVNADRMRQMKPAAIIINTARGGLIDTVALAQALQSGQIASAGLDVFEKEPLPADHPLRECGSAVLNSHVAWFSESSVPKLQRLAALEVARAIRGEPLANRVNK